MNTHLVPASQTGGHKRPASDAIVADPAESLPPSGAQLLLTQICETGRRVRRERRSSLPAFATKFDTNV